MVKKHLGRGLSALLGDDDAMRATTTRGDTGRDIAASLVRIEHLHPGVAQPRRHFDPASLKELANSIASQGVLQPVLVRRHRRRPGEYEILAGERRWRAAQLAKLHEIPVLVREIDDKNALEIALIENIQRADLNAIEEADSYHKLIDQFGYTHEDLAHRLGKSRPHVTQLLGLLTLPQPIQQMLVQGDLTIGHARLLVTLKDPLALANEIIEQGLSVRAAERRAREEKQKAEDKKIGATKKPPSPSAAGPTHEKDADTRALEKRLRQALGMQVELTFDGKGGTLTIQYLTLEQLDDLVRRLG